VLFSSILFIFYFLPVFLAAYLALGLRTSVLLTGSVLFYTWGEGGYVFLLGGLIVLNHLLSRMIAAREGAARRGWLVAALLVDFGVLATFKYADFIVENIDRLLPWFELQGPGLKLPLGISFFTFQLVSYLVDVYRRDVEPESRLDRFATYILMFPHLIAGPIVRYADIRHEIVSRSLSADRFALGLQYFIVGLSQKVLVANTVAPVADAAFALPVAELTAFAAWSGVAAYTLQIFFDFCGYSNMAIGLAMLMGFTFPRNFDYPYAARSLTDFWRRWHMSLSFWFRDYVYKPLGGNKHGRWMTFRNLVIVFFLTGLWHGAAWNFIVWGLFHGAFLLLERAWLGERLKAIPGAVASVYTLMVVMVGWVFFRANDLGHALDVIAAMAGTQGVAGLPIALRATFSPEVLLAFVAGAVLAWPTLPALLDRLGVPRYGRTAAIAEARLDTLHVHALPTLLLLVGFAVSVALLAGSTLNPFLYFRF
jgi:alginate O-acetyltransferase complex protein AlgI